MKSLVLLLFIFFSVPLFVVAQDCGCFTEENKQSILIPTTGLNSPKDGITFQFFWSDDGNFFQDDRLYRDQFMSQVSYESLDEIKKDFNIVSFKGGEYFQIVFDWNKFADWGEHQNWQTITKKHEGVIYIGNYLDVKLNHKAENVKIVEVEISCLHPSCNPKLLLTTIMICLADK